MTLDDYLRTQAKGTEEMLAEAKADTEKVRESPLAAALLQQTGQTGTALIAERIRGMGAMMNKTIYQSILNTVIHGIAETCFVMGLRAGRAMAEAEKKVDPQ